MPALDFCHPQVVRALQKDGWDVRSKSLRVETHERLVVIDIRASRQVNGGQQQVMVAEVKCFQNPDDSTRELYTGLGQYMVYRAILEEKNMNIPLYLAIPITAYETLFDSIIQRVIRGSEIKLLVVDITEGKIVQWKE